MDQCAAFPYENLGDLIYFENVQDPSQQLKQKSEVQFYLRFPWLEFKNSEHKKKYIYLGRQTEKYHPFCIRFNMSEESQQSVSERIGEKLKVVVEAILNPESIQKNAKNMQMVQSMHSVLKTKSLFPTDHFSVHHGFLLTGIAKPSMTINQIYDTLFMHTLKSREAIGAGDQKQNEDDDNSEMALLENERPQRGVYNLMKLTWDYKYHSYEYFRFMCKAYQAISKIFQESLPLDEVDEATCRELFNFNKARTLRCLNKDGEEIVITDLEYFSYFSSIFKKYHREILALMPENQFIHQVKSQEPRKIGIKIDWKQHFLWEFDYSSYFQNQFAGMEVGEASLRRMIEHNRERDEKILAGFPFKTRRQRIELLRKLENENKQVYHRIKLLPLNDLQEEVNAVEEDHNFLILFLRDEEASLANTCFLKEVIDKRISRRNQSLRGITAGMEALKIQKQKIFHDIYRYHRGSSKYQLVEFFSYDPAKIIFEQDGILSPHFQQAMMKMLQLDRLPLTHQQELLGCTPQSEINIYEQLEQLLAEYQQCMKSDCLANFCSILSDQQGGIQFQDSDLEQIAEDELEYLEKQLQENDGKDDCQTRDKALMSLRLKMLELSMIDLEIINFRCLCVDPQRNNSQLPTREPYNAFNSAHYKELRQYLVILLIRTGIVRKVSYSLSYRAEERPAKLDPTVIPTNNIDSIEIIRYLYEGNCSRYKNYVKCNTHRRYFRQVDQNTFRSTILGFYEEFEVTNFGGFWHVRDMLRLSLKVYVALQFLETRLEIAMLRTQKNQDQQSLQLLQSKHIQNLEPFRKIVEGMAKQEKDNKADLQDLRWKNMNQRYYKDLKEAITVIQKQFTFCKNIFKSSSLNSEEVRRLMRKKQDSKIIDNIHKKIDAINNSNLIVFCGLFNDLVKLEDNDFDRMNLIYKILLCFCCHSQQFHKNQVFQYRIDKLLNLEKIEPKVYKLKSVLFTEIINFIMENKSKYFSHE